MKWLQQFEDVKGQHLKRKKRIFSDLTVRLGLSDSFVLILSSATSIQLTLSPPPPAKYFTRHTPKNITHVDGWAF